MPFVVPAALAAAAVAPEAKAIDLVIDPSRSVISIETAATVGDPLDAELSGGVTLATSPGSAPFATAGIVSLDAVVADPLVRQVPSALGILAFDVPANEIMVNVSSTGSTANTVDIDGSFDQGDLTFVLGGNLNGQLLDPTTLDPLGTFAGNLADAFITGGGPLVGQMIEDATLLDEGGVLTLTTPIDLAFSLPLTLTLASDPDTPIQLPIGVTVVGEVVAQVPEPASAALVAAAGGLLLRRRRD